MAKDIFHDAVKAALKKDKWDITDDPYRISVGGVEMEQDGQKIAVEVKSFVGKSAISEFHTAHGQFLDYCFALEEQEPSRKLYLAVPMSTYRTFFQLKFTQSIIQRSHLNLIVYNPEMEVITEWL
jgi:XisH protein